MAKLSKEQERIQKNRKTAAAISEKQRLVGRDKRATKDRLEIEQGRAKRERKLPPQLIGGRIVTGEDIEKDRVRKIAERNVQIDREESKFVKETGIKEEDQVIEQQKVSTETEEKGKSKIETGQSFTDATGVVHTIPDIKSEVSREEFKSLQREQILDPALRVLGIAGPIGRGVNIAANPIVNTIFKTLMTKKALIGLSTSIAGADIIGTWYAADNVQSAIPFHLKEVRKGLADGTVTPEKATELVTEAQDNFDKAGSFITKSTMINPILMPFRNLYMSGQEQKQAEIDIIVNSMTQ